MRNDIWIGADPELFLTKEGIPVSAHELIPGSKKEPHPIGYGNSIQVDGLAVEFNTKPVTIRQEFINCIKNSLTDLKAMLPGYEFTQESAIRFPKEYMRSLPEEVLSLGCSPDMNAYDYGFNPPPNSRSTLRTAAGHIHIGYNIYDFPEYLHNSSLLACILTQKLDLYLGVPSIILDEKGSMRRRMYGKAGAYRKKPYGLEYRVLSNFWVFEEKLISWVFSSIHKTINNISEYHYHEDVQKAINRNDKELARRIMKDENIELPL